MQKKSLLSLLLTLVLTLGLMGTPAFAAGGTPRLVLKTVSANEERVGIENVPNDCHGVQVTLNSNIDFTYQASDVLNQAGVYATSKDKTLYVVSRTPLPLEQSTLWLGSVTGTSSLSLNISGASEIKMIDAAMADNILGGGGSSGGGGGGGGGGSSSISYGIQIEESQYGTITVDRRQASADTLVTVTLTPNSGYHLKEVAVIAKTGNNVKVNRKDAQTYTFAMPKSDVTVRATFVEGQGGALPFVDVTSDAWFYGPVLYVYEHGLMSGINDREFAPNQTLTRAMIAQILYAMEGKPQHGQSGTFTDVTNQDWFASAVNWAAAQGLVSGVGEGLFAPNSSLTREQLAAILYRYAQSKGIQVVGVGQPLTSYQDHQTVSSWAKDAMEWAVGAGLISGMDGGILAPSGTATRAQVATILTQFAKILP